jgi:hypothetical protein
MTAKGWPVPRLVPVAKMTEPYAPPQSSPDSGAFDDEIRQRRAFWLRAIWVSIAGVMIPLIFGVLGTIVGMVGAFGELSETGEADPAALADNISVSLSTSMWGAGFSAIAFLVLIGVLIRFFTLPKSAGKPHANIQAREGKTTDS